MTIIYLKKNRKKGDTQYYKCVQNTCTSRLSIDLVQNIIVNQPGSHNHFRPEEQIAQQDFRSKVLQSVENNPTIPLNRVFKEEIQQVDTENFIFPRYNQMRGSMSRKRASCLPPVPTVFDRVKVEGSWTLALNFKRFLLHQEPQILIFATDQGLEFLARSRNLLCDGTFKTAPPPFKQIYTLFGATTEWKVPVVWAFLGSKNEAIYHRFFWLLSNKCTEILNIPLVPEFIVTDYESGVIPAVRTVFFGSEQVGCWFHYSQCIYRKIQDIGLSREYSSNEIIQNVSRKLFSLPFLPPNEIVRGFQVYENQLQTIFLVYPSLESLSTMSGTFGFSVIYP